MSYKIFAYAEIEGKRVRMPHVGCELSDEVCQNILGLLLYYDSIEVEKIEGNVICIKIINRELIFPECLKEMYEQMVPKKI